MLILPILLSLSAYNDSDTKDLNFQCHSVPWFARLSPWVLTEVDLVIGLLPEPNACIGPVLPRPTPPRWFPPRALPLPARGPVVTVVAGASVDSIVGFQISLSKSDELEIRRILLL